MTVSTEVPVAPIENIKTEIDIIPEKPQIESKWQIAKRNVTSSNSGLQPRPRHGHRVVSIRGLILLFGGGNGEVMDDLMVYSTENGNWFQPSCNGDVPPGVAAHGMIADGTRIIIHGGMMEYGKQTNQMYELQASKWEWKKLSQKGTKNSEIPSARMCHSFNSLGSKIVLFGGVTNRSDAPERVFKPDYLNDIYFLDLKSGSGVQNWLKPECTGQGPSARESHSSVVYKPEGRAPMLVVYGGKDMHSRLGDIFSLDTGSNSWTELKPLGISPPPRSMHSAVLISGNRMVVIGGLIPISDEIQKLHHGDDPSGKSVWKSDNSMHVLDLDADEWLEKGIQGEIPEAIPSLRSGAAATLIESRIYLFAGKENDKNCTNEMCYLETSVPAKPTNVRLIKGMETSIQVAWNPIKNADSYLIQLSPVTPEVKKVEEKKKPEPTEEAKKEEAAKKIENEINMRVENPPLPTEPEVKPPPLPTEPEIQPPPPPAEPKPENLESAPNSEKMDVDEPVKPIENAEKRAESPAQLPAGALTQAPTALVQASTSPPSEPPKPEAVIAPEPKPEVKPELTWYDSAIIKSTKYEIRHYFVKAEAGDELTEDDKLMLDNNQNWKKMSLQSGVMYRVRICGLNSCGRSVFSDYSAYKTIVPGFPGAPSSIKVNKVDSGAALSWMPPANTDIIEYSVYLAVKQLSTSGKTNNFVRVYLGHEPTCIVSHNQLGQAATNTESSNKPAVIFRIAAKNKKGYGPATQVRWLQDAKTKRQANTIANNKDVKKSKA